MPLGCVRASIASGITGYTQLENLLNGFTSAKGALGIGRALYGRVMWGMSLRQVKRTSAKVLNSLIQMFGVVVQKFKNRSLDPPTTLYLGSVPNK